MRPRFYALSLLVTLSGCATTAPSAAHKPAVEALDSWVQREQNISWRNLKLNISPRDPKTAGGPAPIPGIVVAGLSKKDPDYYFHWVRDSSNVMRTVIELYASQPQVMTPAQFHSMMGNYLRLSSHLQHEKSAFGLGEPRYMVTGEADTLPWSRPQFDGPALRALSVMKYLEWQQTNRDTTDRDLALSVLRTDLDFIVSVWSQRGFDIWEEYKADNYNTRLAQLVALEKSNHWLPSPRYQKVAIQLATLLDDHWDPARGFLRSQLAIAATDGYTAKKTDLDSAVIVTVMDVDRESEGHSVMDDRVQATALVLEDLFRTSFAINRQNDDLGPAFGRYSGDVYYGGNPWYLITSYYAQFYYRLAARLKDHPYKVTKINLAFARAILHMPTLAADSEFKPGESQHTLFTAALREKAESILRRVQWHTPSDGVFFEQFDKNTGQPVSARGLGWAYSAFLAASLERNTLAVPNK